MPAGYLSTIIMKFPKFSLPKIPVSLNFPSLERKGKKKITSVSANFPKYIYLKTVQTLEWVESY